MNSGFAYDWEPGGAARSAAEGRTLQVAALFSWSWARAQRLALRFRSRECDAARWLLAAHSWDFDLRRSNCRWSSFYVLGHVSWQNTIARLHINESVQLYETSSGSSKSWSRHPTPWKHLSRGWYHPAWRSFRSTPWTASKFQHLFPCLPFASSRVPFSGHWPWPSHCYRLSWVRNHLWRCEHDARRPPCSSKLHHREIYIENTYRILTMPVCTELRNWIWDAERGFRLVGTGLQLQAGTGSLPPSPSDSMEKLPHMTDILVWGRGKQGQITRFHWTCQAVHASSWSGKSTCGGGQACRSALYGGG